MKIAQIEENVKNVLLHSTQQDFLADFLLAFGKPKASISRLQVKGHASYNLSKDEHEVLWKNNVLYKFIKHDQLDSYIEEHADSDIVRKHKPRFIIATDFNTLVARDTRTEETLKIAFPELPNHVEFFLPWAGMEKATHTPDSPADVKAAEKMAKLFDMIRLDNPTKDVRFLHSLNVFLTRLLFCFFAEDTDIFSKDLFSNSIQSHTSEDGQDLSDYLASLFGVLNTEDRTKCPGYFRQFPYVNGGLFAEQHPVPKFSARSRSILIECGTELNWSEINPDIFGSMIQAVVDTDQRANMGMHYTSVTNIMKVIDPLFLRDLYEELEKSRANTRKLRELLIRLGKIKIFDPACGSGNFLILAYKELRKLEMEILNQISVNEKQADLGLSTISLSQFYGIELDDFAHEVALLSLWLAEHQMNLVFRQRFGKANPTLPLKPSGNILCDNAARVDWRTVCDNTSADPVYVLGNPPYLGARNQELDQKEDLRLVFDGHEDYKDSDYISTWILKGSIYIKEQNSSFAFVSTNSICQGEQVAYIWPRVWKEGLEIGFAHQSFKWSNNAKKNAGVTCVIIGVRNISNKPKILYGGSTRAAVSNISPYLTTGSDICVARTSSIISNLPLMSIGSMARDGGHLIMTEEEKNTILDQYPKSKPLLKRLTGTNEFITGVYRWCLWIEDEQLDLAMSIPPIKKRIQEVYKFRIESKAKTTNEYAKIPHKFAQRCYQNRHSIVVPSTTSERRQYIPIGYFEPGVVITNSANAIYDASPLVFGIVSSKLHIVWVRSIGGQLETRLRYAPEIVYNTFPFPSINKEQERQISEAALAVLAEREQHPDNNIEYLYDPDTMPESLRAAHAHLDSVIEKCFRTKPFVSDEERLEFMLKLYEKMTETEDA